MVKLNHLGVIPDGNRRWAKKNNKSYLEAYSIGIKKIEELIEWWGNSNIKILSVYALSYENLVNRSKEELNILFSLFKNYLTNELGRILEIANERGISINFVGEKDRLPEGLINIMDEIEKETNNNSKKELNILIAYSGRRELYNAIKRLDKDIVDENDIVNKLWIKKDVDLIIRTGGYHRLSNFLIYQSAYAELYFIDKLWPDVAIQDIENAIKWYYNVKRNFGK